MDGLEIIEDLFEPSSLETTNTYVKMHGSTIIFLCPHYKACFYQRKWACFTRLVSVASSVFTTNSVREEWKALIVSLHLTQWLPNGLKPINQTRQEALVLAQWPTPTKDRNHQQNTHCHKLISWMPTKPRPFHSKPAVSRCDTQDPSSKTQRSENCG